MSATSDLGRLLHETVSAPASARSTRSPKSCRIVSSTRAMASPFWETARMRVFRELVCGNVVGVR